MLTPKDQIPPCPTGVVRLPPIMVESGVIELVCRMRADLSVPIGGGTFRSWFALFDFAWPKEGGAEAADRGEEAPEETDGGDSPVQIF